MEIVELSDLEEGEILEYDSSSPVDSSEDFEAKNRSFGSLKKEITNYNFDLKNAKERNSCLDQQEKHGYLNKNLRNKLELSWNLSESKAGTVDLESISSEEEYKSEDSCKYRAGHKDRPCYNGEKRRKKKQSSHLYGTVEDIMSKIGETICRKSRCNYKKRKSKDFVKYSDSSYDVWRDQMFSSHIKEKNRKRRTRCSDSESELAKYRVEKRKKRKKREVYYDEVGMGTTKKSKMRDFDEMRRNLLEKLKKEKAEGLKASANASAPEVENSEIQEVDMLIDCTNYVDDSVAATEENSLDEMRRDQEKENDDELDIIKLRLIALASNKGRKSAGNQRKTETPEDAAPVGDKKADEGNRGETDLDRNELLLRAEALKTALLKKHQKRLNKLKHENPKAVECANVSPLSSPAKEGPVCKDTETESGGQTEKENEGESRGEETVGVSEVPLSQISDSQNSQKEPSVPDAVPKKANIKAKNKRRKRKSCSLANSLKENNEKSEALEEDDRTLRSQLLSDLMRKKSLKDLEKKPVLTSLSDVQVSANQIPVLIRRDSLSKGNSKPPRVLVQRNPLKKVNVMKTSKADLVPKIPKAEIQRIIVHLGSDESSDEKDGQEEKTAVAQSESETKGTAQSTEVREKAKEVVQVNYEKSVELLLNQARKKIEGKMQTTMNSSSLNTPEAVYKHLPPSQRLEYIRLKQKIAERERLRKQQSDASTKSKPPEVTTDSEKPHPKPENPLTNSVPMNSCVNTGVSSSKLESRSANGVLTKSTAPRSALNKMKNGLAGAHGKGLKKHPLAPGSVGSKASPTSSSLLLPSSQALISKLKLLLKKIKIEKMIEENYQKEIARLKNQLNLFERKKTEQRFKIKKLGEESMKTYRAIQGVTARTKEGKYEEEKKKEGGMKETEKKAVEAEKKAVEAEKKAVEPEKKVVEPEKKAVEAEKKAVEPEKKAVEAEKKAAETEKKAEEGKKLAYEPETETTKAETEIDKELNIDGCDKVSDTVSNGTSLVVSLLKYSSPLEVFQKASDPASRVDPNVIMCQFDLMGVCKDEECTYQHLRTS